MIQSPETKLKTVSMISVESGAEISSEIWLSRLQLAFRIASFEIFLSCARDNFIKKHKYYKIFCKILSFSVSHVSYSKIDINERSTCSSEDNNSRKVYK
jgi:hypothetical protein